MSASVAEFLKLVRERYPGNDVVLSLGHWDKEEPRHFYAYLKITGQHLDRWIEEIQKMQQRKGSCRRLVRNLRKNAEAQ